MDTDENLKAVTLAWVKGILDHKGIKATGLARESDVSQSSLSRFLNGDADTLSAESLARIAAISPIAVPSRIQTILDRRPRARQERSVNMFQEAAGDVPVYGVIPVARDGEFYLNPVALKYFIAPHGRKTSRKLASFYAPDETMAPRWQPGEPVFVDLGRPGAPGEVALIKLAATRESPNDSETYLFRRYDGRREGKLRASDLATGQVTEVPLDRVLEVRRILTWSDMSE